MACAVPWLAIPAVCELDDVTVILVVSVVVKFL